MGTKKLIEGSNGISASQLSDLFRQIEDGSLSRRHVSAFLSHENPFISPFPTDLSFVKRWAVVLTEGVNLSRLIQLLQGGEERLDHVVSQFLIEQAHPITPTQNVFSVGKKRTIVLTKISVKDLGFDYRPTVEEIYERASKLALGKLSLVKCDPEEALYIALQLKEKLQDGKYNYVAMDPLIVRESKRIFCFDINTRITLEEIDHLEKVYLNSEFIFKLQN